MSYHATNSSHVTDHLLSSLLSLRYVLRCMLLEIALNAGSVVLEGAGGVRLPVATGHRSFRAHMLAHFMVRLYIAVVCSYGEALADRIISYRIVSYRDILSDIVSYLSFSLMAVSCHHYMCQNTKNKLLTNNSICAFTDSI